jgi:hypothetical protein
MPWMVAAANGGYGDFVAGLVIGGAGGFLVGPAVRSWIAWREWSDASRQARLTDEVLARMDETAEEGLEGDPSSGPSARPGTSSSNGTADGRIPTGP